MGVINLTPDSFYAASRQSSVHDAVRTAHAMVQAGADILDLGPMSSRPGSQSISEDEEIERLVPALAAICSEVDVPVSVDTYRPQVAVAATAAGASILNDITGLHSSDALARTAAAAGAALVVMHMRGTPDTMQADTSYDDVVVEVREALTRSANRARAAGLADDQIIVDPGIGFGKSAAGNVELLARLPELAALGLPVLIGASRKSFIGHYCRVEADDRLPGSLAAAVAAVLQGAAVLRVHDVAESAQAMRLARVVRDARRQQTPASS